MPEKNVRRGKRIARAAAIPSGRKMAARNNLRRRLGPLS